MLLGSLGFGVSQVVAAVMPGYVSFVVVLVPMGIAFMTYVTTLNATFQLSVDPQMRGRVMSMFMLVFMGVAPLGAPVVGLIADGFGPRASLTVGGVVTIAVVTVLGALLARTRGVRPRDLLPGPRGRRGTSRSAGGEPAGPEEPAETRDGDDGSREVPAAR